MDENLPGKELWKKIRQIELRTNKLVTELFSGEYRSAFKGKGLEFKEFKIYEEGDDTRHIDWRASARKGFPLVKRFVEERELTLLLVLDVSNSTFFGSNKQLKSELIAEFSASITFSGLKNNDKIGLILFGDKIYDFIPPKKGRNHVLRILKKILSFTYTTNQGGKTNLETPLKLINKLFRKKVIVFFVSDFLSENYEKEIKLINAHHDLIAVIVSDYREFDIPEVGLIELTDPETSKTKIIDTDNKKTIIAIKEKLDTHRKETLNFLKKNKIDRILINTSESFVIPLTNFFKTRERRF